MTTHAADDGNALKEIPRAQLPDWVTCEVPAGERIIKMLSPSERIDTWSFPAKPGSVALLVENASGYQFQRTVDPPTKDTVIRARVPADLAARLHEAGAATGAGASAVLRSLLAQGLEEFEARDATKIADPAARARFIAKRLERKSKAPPPPPVPVGPDGLTDFERRDAAKIADPAAKARFIASRLRRRAK